MSLFKNLATDTSIKEDADVLGGGKFSPWESGAYDAIIELAYVSESAKGAMSVDFVCKTSEGKELKQTIYVTGGKEKGQLNYYLDKEGNKKYLPGFSLVNDICLLASGEALSDMESETKVLSLYDWQQKKVVPTKKEVLTDLIGKEITLGVLKIQEFKKVKDSGGAYVNSTDIRIINEISKTFRTKDYMTANEIRAESEEAAFYKAWKEKNTGITVDRTAGAKASSPAAPATSAAAGTAEAPKRSLFNK